MEINPAWLQTFLTLVQTRHFTRTARALAMTQPGVSQHLQKLEAHFGAELVRRQGKTFELTDAGRRVEGYARRLFQEHARFQDELRQEDARAGVCRFASPASFGAKLHGVLLRLNQKNRGWVIEFSFRPEPEILGALALDQIEVGFVTARPKDPGLACRALFRDRLCLAVPRGFSGHSLTALQELGFIGHPEGALTLSRLLDRNFPGATVQQVPLRGSVDSVAHVLEPVARGLGFTALPESACQAFTGANQIRVLRLRHPVTECIYWIQKKHRPLPPRFALIEKGFKATGR